MRNITNRLSFNRILYCVAISVIFISGTIISGVLSKLLVDQMICLIILDVVYLLVFILTLIRKRLDNDLPGKENSYSRITFFCFLFWVITILCVLFAPDFFAPIIIIPLLGNVVFDESTNFAISLYFVFVLGISQNFNANMILCYSLLIVFGILISYFLVNDEYLEKIYGNIILFAVNILLQMVFYYFNFWEVTAKCFFFAVIESIVILLMTIVFLPMLKQKTKEALADIYDTILEPEYSLVKEIRNFSYIEYQHASRVSRLSRMCAEIIGVNERLAACGGFYYRLGKLLGEPMIDNAIKIANDHCFSSELIQILFEYGGIIALPSCPESAIVHMVDSVVTKVELFDFDSMTSTWNQNMVIYQTINELSQKGLYDKANLSMNQFLKIREKLAQEDILA